MARKKTNNKIDTAAKKWLQDVLLTKKYSTYVKYQNTYNKYIQPFINDKSLEQITNEDCIRFLEKAYIQYRNKLISHSTYSSIKIVLFQILNYAKSPISVRKIKECLPPAGNNRQQISVLTNDEQKKLEAFLMQEIDFYKIGIFVCLYTGLRIGEICALTTDSIDLSRKCIYVRQSVQRIKTADNDRKTHLLISDPKTASSQREVPLCNFLIELLSIYIPQSEYLLGEKPMEPRTYQYKLSRYFAALSIKGKHFHSLRHTFATNCIESGMDPKCLSEILGHADVNTTLNRYVHPSFNSKIRQINILANTIECGGSFSFPV